jgi:hypothetical protein
MLGVLLLVNHERLETACVILGVFLGIILIVGLRARNAIHHNSQDNNGSHTQTDDNTNINIGVMSTFRLLITTWN